MKLYFLRHGVTDLNQQYLFQGRIDTQLNSEGIRQAEEVAQSLKGSGITFDRICCSPLTRAKQTCEIATGRTQDTFEIDERLVELHYGRYEGKPIMESDQIMMKFLKNPYENDPPEGVENMHSLRERMDAVLTDILNSSKEDDSILICSHGIALSAMFRVIYERNGIIPERIVPHHAKLYVCEANEGRVEVPREPWKR